MSESYERDSIFLGYVKWHYGQGFSELMGVAHNFLWFVAHFFSFKLLLRTIFAPWKRLGENYTGGFNLGAFASTLIVNTLMRAVGFVTKMMVLALGSIAYVSVALLSLFLALIWVLAPVILLGSVLLSATFFVV